MLSRLKQRSFTPLEQQLFAFMRDAARRPIVIVCVGTDRSTGDALGPLVGSLLTEQHELHTCHCFGTLDDPIHAVNLVERYEAILASFATPFVVGIDASLGTAQQIGTITLHPHPLRPGSALHKQLPEIGDISLTGTVNMTSVVAHLTLSNTRLAVVMKLAQHIARLIATVDRAL